MKEEKGLGLIGALLILSIIAVLIVVIVYNVKNNTKNEKDNEIKANMLLIQGACKVLNQNSLVKKNTDILIGTKLSDYKIYEVKAESEINQNSQENVLNESNEDNNISEISEDKKNSDRIISEFEEKNIIDSADYSKYYILTDENLESLKIKVKNEKESYYLINYETSEVIITKGYEGKYKLSEIS